MALIRRPQQSRTIVPAPAGNAPGNANNQLDSASDQNTSAVTAADVERDLTLWFGSKAAELLLPDRIRPLGGNPCAHPRDQHRPKTLPMLSDAAKASLDPYMALIVGYRKSGLSLNHIIGCPLDCGYCVRYFWGNFKVKIPHLLCNTDEAVQMLIEHHAFQPHITPIQLFNKQPTRSCQASCSKYCGHSTTAGIPTIFL